MDRRSPPGTLTGTAYYQKSGVMEAYTKAGQKTSMDDCRRGHARGLDTGKTMIEPAVQTVRVEAVSELEAEVSLTASAQSLEDETSARTAATAVGAMIVKTATDTTTVTVSTKVMNVADVVIEVGIADGPIVVTRSTKSMIISPSLIRRVTDHLWFSAGRRRSRGGMTKRLLPSVAE